MSVLQRAENGASVEFVLSGGNIKHELVFSDLGEITLEQLQKLFAKVTMFTVYTATKPTVEKCRWVDAPTEPQKHVPVPAVQPKPAQNGPRLKASVPTPAVIPLPTQNFPMMKAYKVHEIPAPRHQFAKCEEFEEFDLASVNDPAP